MTFRTEHGPWAAKMYRSGRTIKQIAQFYNVRAQTVSRAFKDMGVNLHPNGFFSRATHKFSHEKAIKLYEGGESLSVVAEEFGVTPKAVLYVLQKNGVPTRKPGSGRHKPKSHVPIVRTLLSRGLSRDYISKVTGRSKHCVARIEGSLGAPSRNSKHYPIWVARLAREAMMLQAEVARG